MSGSSGEGEINGVTIKVWEHTQNEGATSFSVVVSPNGTLDDLIKVVYITRRYAPGDKVEVSSLENQDHDITPLRNRTLLDLGLLSPPVVVIRHTSCDSKPATVLPGLRQFESDEVNMVKVTQEHLGDVHNLQQRIVEMEQQMQEMQSSFIRQEQNHQRDLIELEKQHQISVEHFRDQHNRDLDRIRILQERNKKLQDLQKVVELQRDRFSNKLNTQEHGLEHALSHISKGKWTFNTPQTHKRKEATKVLEIALPGNKVLRHHVCRRCPLDKVVRMLVQQETGIAEAEQEIVFNGKPLPPLLSIDRIEKPLSSRDEPDPTSVIKTASITHSDTLMVTVRIPKLKELNNFQLLEIIGHSVHGTVFKGVIRPDNADVAVKKLHTISGPVSTILLELETVAHLRNPNIVYCLGACTGRDLLIVSEFMKLSLKRLLEVRPCSGTESVCVLFGISLGLKTLHKLGIPHHNLHSGNVFFDDDGVPKLCDFGVSRYCLPSQKGGESSISCYLSPQMRANLLSIKGDVWQFGILACEVFTNTLPDTSPVVPTFLESHPFPQGETAEIERLISLVGMEPIIECLDFREKCITSLVDRATATSLGIFSSTVSACLEITEKARPQILVVETMLKACIKHLCEEPRSPPPIPIPSTTTTASQSQTCTATTTATTSNTTITQNPQVFISRTLGNLRRSVQAQTLLEARNTPPSLFPPVED
ncbi:Protein tyrosine and serine/threonine kinase [Pelomyxa schiedti]|nr:Protein tyrosine and serine/threonine kinase [Pelomyxa schiedti]